MKEAKQSTRILTVIAGRGLARGLSLVGFVVVARHFGAADLGRVAWVLGMGAFFGSVVQFGLGNVLPRYFGGAEHDAAVQASVRWRAGLGAVCAVLFPLGYAWLAPAPALAPGYILLYAASFLVAWLNVGEEWMYFEQQHRTLFVSGVAGSAANLGWRLGVVIFGGPVGLLLAVPGLEALVRGAVNGWRGRDRLRLFPRPGEAGQARAVARSMGRDGTHLVIAGLGVMVLTRLDLLMLGWMRSEAEVGVYAVAVQLVDLVTLCTAVVVGMWAKELVRAHADGESAFFAAVRPLLAGGIWSILGLAVIAALIGTPVIAAVFGAGYAGAGPVVAVLVVAQAFVFVGLVRGRFLALVDNTSYAVWSTAVGALINLALNAWAIPRYGLLGAAGATATARIFMSLLLPLAVRKQRWFNRALLAALFIPWRKGVAA